ncbi:MAG TPA: hypothetical protein DCS67_09235, partial [Clostridiales bacterium UBA8960]|nr:hypothetical protein [Clostridiales bacterium UBA8960]
KPENYKAHSRSDSGLTFRALHQNDLEEVVGLYKGVFKSFARQEYMVNKLMEGHGRGVIARLNGQLVAVAQTDYETENTALIVGVATRHDHQGKGYGRAIMEALCTPLIADGKTLALQYDSAIAGALYESLGFKRIEQIYYVKNISK